jgi:hypothetical protein
MGNIGTSNSDASSEQTDADEFQNTGEILETPDTTGTIRNTVLDTNQQSSYVSCLLI